MFQNNYFNKAEFDFKNNAFDFIRLILAIIVVVFHAMKVGNFPELTNWFYYPQQDWDKSGSYIGSLSVNIFFAISGFLIAKSAINSSSLVSFFKKRLYRIYPGYFVSLVLTCFLFVPIIVVSKLGVIQNFEQIILETLRFFFRNLFIETPVIQIPSVDSGYINGSYWTLIQEFRAYIIAGLVVWIAKYTQDKFQKFFFKNLILAIALVLNLIYFAGSKDFEFRDKLDFIFTDFRFFVVFCYFFVGASFYVFLDKIRWTLKWFLVSCFGIWIGFNFNLLGLFLPICGTYWILYLSQIISVQNLAKKYGDWSYGVYIYSSPILSTLASFGVPQFGFYVYSSMAVIISIVFGYLSYHLVEKRFLKR